MDTVASRLVKDVVPSSSPAFATPAHPIKPHSRPIAPPAFNPIIPTIIAVQLPPASLRPLAFRTLTKKHNLTLSSPALQVLSTFVGRHCGSGWREEGTAERVLEEVAKAWKKGGGALIVDDGTLLKSTLKFLEGCMSGGRIQQGKIGLSRQSSGFQFSRPDSPIDASGNDPGGGDVIRPPLLNHTSSFGLSGLDVSQDETRENDDPGDKHASDWIKVVDARSQPRLTYNTRKKHFDRITTPATLLAPPMNKTALFRDRYHIIHQRILRNPAFQAPSFNARTLRRQDTVAQLQNFRITPIANLLGRSGSTHLLLGLLVITPTGSLALNDLTGGITLDLDYARALDDRGAEEAPWIFPGCIVLVEGVYQEEFSGAGSSGLGGGGGVGGMIGGKFVGLTIGMPPCERRSATLGATDARRGNDESGVGAGYGWTDFLGVGSEKATGTRMRRLEETLLRDPSQDESARKIVVLGEVNLNDPDCIEALREVLKRHSSEEAASPPLSFIVTGNFVSHAVMSRGGIGGGGSGSIEYKEYLNTLAGVLGEYPDLLVKSKWVFVPGDNDPWPSAFAAGASTTIPRNGVPALFTSRVKRAFVDASAGGAVPMKRSADDKPGGEAIWTTNPSRLTLFGAAHEIVIFRDDMTGRMRRSAINYGKLARQEEAEGRREDEDTVMASAVGLDDAGADVDMDIEALPEQTGPDHATIIGRKLILSLLPQSHLSPFPLSTRPVHWDFGSALSLYPLPHTLILADAEAPAFAITYEGCHVMNPGRLCKAIGKRKRVGWIEYDALSKRGEAKQLWI